MTPPDAAWGASRNRVPPSPRVGTDYGSPQQAAQLRQKRDATVARTTTRWATDRFPFSPYWLIVIDWPNERCPGSGLTALDRKRKHTPRPRCRERLEPGTQALFDEDEQACFCFACALWLLEHPGNDKPPPRQAPTPKTWRPTPLQPF